MMLKDFDFEKFLERIESNDVVVEFDARTGHNHGTKFRWYDTIFLELYSEATTIIENGTVMIDVNEY